MFDKCIHMVFIIRNVSCYTRNKKACRRNVKLVTSRVIGDNIVKMQLINAQKQFVTKGTLQKVALLQILKLITN